MMPNYLIIIATVLDKLVVAEGDGIHNDNEVPPASYDDDDDNDDVEVDYREMTPPLPPPTPIPKYPR